MEMFSQLRIGLCNGWLLVALFALVFGALLIIFPRDVVTRLYERPRRTRSQTVRRTLGVFLALVWLALAILTPLRHAGVVLAIGLTLYAGGLTGLVLALFSYAHTPADQPVTSGLYRISRHPQQVMVSLVFLGVSIAMGSWLALGLIGIGLIGGHVKVVAEEKACLEKYGESYREYMKQVPRYFLIV
jgi:protein-S-isoprenylcysteine O-methyltransferase Ste14